MKFTSSIALAALSSMAIAAPHDNINKRAVASGPVGYASTNGGTTGGQGGATTTVSTLAQFTKAATLKEPTVVYISGKITGNTKVKVTSDTSIIGLNSNSALENTFKSATNQDSTSISSLCSYDELRQPINMTL
ncbi:hypothetical protein M436DRAFT_64170 [Aureobasidium namibiae CBS 147.97]|uniref:Pectate lyase n=1 Tax=Aureobasidium namibiae CBS 147.97 TaxID=1043004 RepID=A0A074WN43_9PEZI